MGKQLKLAVIEVTPERNRLIFSERSAYHRKDTKHDILESLEIGSVHKGIVSNIVPFGAFVNVDGVDGLLHVSELSWKRVNDPHEIVQVGQTIDVFVLDVDLDKERLGLSLKRLVSDPWTTVGETCAVGDVTEVKVVNLTSFRCVRRSDRAPRVGGADPHLRALACQRRPSGGGRPGRAAGDREDHLGEAGAEAHRVQPQGSRFGAARPSLVTDTDTGTALRIQPWGCQDCGAPVNQPGPRCLKGGHDG